MYLFKEFLFTQKHFIAKKLVKTLGFSDMNYEKIGEFMKALRNISILMALLSMQYLAAEEMKRAQWNILIYMDGMEKLYSAAIKNITEAMAGYKEDNARVFIQMHADSETSIAYRYHLATGKLIYDTTVNLEKNDHVKNIVSSASWAFKEHPAQYNGLVFWNHGFGILDPTWQQTGTQEQFGWRSEPDIELTRTLHKEHKHHRGIFLDNIAQTYLNNEQMIQTLSHIKKQILNNRKLDFLGTDTCGMAMLETAWQIRDYAHYFIGAQNCALKDGWPYYGIMNALSSKSYTPLQCVHMIIEEYANYYKQTKAETYTQAVIDLSKINMVKETLDKIVTLLMQNFDKEMLSKLAYKARKKCPVFCIHPTYTDLWTFYDELSQELNGNTEQIKQLLQAGKWAIEQAIVAYTTGKDMIKAHGLSIYFPYRHIDSSYFKTEFGHDSLWLPLLQHMLM